MRQTISGLVAAIAVVAASAAPAMACGWSGPCGQIYLPAYTYSTCNTGCGGWGYERLPDPVEQYHSAPIAQPQYYYADQGPTYTGPGNFAPYPVYREGGVSGWNGYRHHYGYQGYRTHRYGAYTGYHYGPRYHARHRSLRYGYYGAFHHYGYREHVLRRYY
jgi:hypothetical protein